MCNAYLWKRNSFKFFAVNVKNLLRIAKLNKRMAHCPAKCRDICGSFLLFLALNSQKSVVHDVMIFRILCSALTKSVACFGHTISLSRCPSKARTELLNPQYFYTQHISITDVFLVSKSLSLAREIWCNTSDKMCIIMQVDLLWKSCWCSTFGSDRQIKLHCAITDFLQHIN